MTRYKDIFTMNVLLLHTNWNYWFIALPPSFTKAMRGCSLPAGLHLWVFCMDFNIILFLAASCAVRSFFGDVGV